MYKKEKIAEILLKENILTPQKLRDVEEEVKKTGLSFPKALDKKGIISEVKLTQLIAQDAGVPFVDISEYLIDIEVIKLVPKRIAKKYSLIPLFKIGNTLTVAMINPKDVSALEELRELSGLENIEAVLSTEELILKAIEDNYAGGEKVEDILKGMGAPGGADKKVGIKEAPIIKIVDLTIGEALKKRASDIHIEPGKDVLRLRYRIDGVLHEINTFPVYLQSPIISRIKLMAGMDIAESRLPQDGRISIKVENKELDIRVSSFPTTYGENIVMRILEKSSVLKGMSDLGFLKKDLNKFERLIHFPFGIILVTGPTGCGKTTTLYAALTAVNSMEKNIVTVEDPVEYELPLIRQTQVNPKIGLTFAHQLRAILRQDPDIIMVGEIRDLETAEVAIRAALTGHLVFSTLHTNDAPSALTRLIDMGIEPFLASSTLIGILAQRLLRLICKSCKEKYTPPEEVLKSLDSHGITEVYHGKGCSECNYTGFLGRTGIFEFLTVSEKLKKIILKKPSSEELRQVALEEGMNTLYQDGIEKVKKGLTSIEEVLRVTREFE